MWYYCVMIRRNTAGHYILKALIPYTEENLKLAFKPKLFFSELEKIQRLNKDTSRKAYYKAVHDGFIDIDSGTPQLTARGYRALAPFTARKLKGAQLLVVFDIPEKDRVKRRLFRSALREFSFCQIQKSVWMSNYDCAKYIRESAKSLSLQKHVRIFEALEL